MNLKQAIDSQVFLNNYWQKKPLVFRDVFTNSESLISGHELAGLACEENIESRIITGSNKDENWQCQFGPFKENYNYDALGINDWTLLVQSVDHFIPDVREVLKHFDFIPKWRLDDVMLSYAASGGGVGPHFDYYDVFLIQTSGSREWKIGQICDETTPLREHEDLKLLKNFAATESHELHPGDMIYIPAGVAHWGTATSDNCITASIGFRAPAYQDLVYQAALDISNQFKENLRYTDETLSGKDSFNLNNIAEKDFSTILQSFDQDNFKRALRFAFAKEVTTPRHQELYEHIEIGAKSVSNNLRQLHKHPNARFVYLEDSGTVTLFANGIAFDTDLDTAKAVCHEQFDAAKSYDLDTLTELSCLGYLLIE